MVLLPCLTIFKQAGFQIRHLCQIPHQHRNCMSGRHLWAAILTLHRSFPAFVVDATST